MDALDGWRGIMNRRRGLTLVELLVALAVTALVAAGVASLLAGLGAGLAVGADTRTGMLASVSTHRRLVESLTPGVVVLRADGDDALVWFGDDVPGGVVEASEAAWLILDRERGELGLETIEFPDDLPPFERALLDRRLVEREDDRRTLAELRGRGFTRRLVLADGLVDGMLSTERQGGVLRIEVRFDLQTGPAPWSSTLLMPGEAPEGWSP
ncbi:MAG: hypothetical protein CMJ34_00645 [Phycisphaerae bacterium]|nr:hypothetical protein [Phycisphaerae bacterium]